MTLSTGTLNLKFMQRAAARQPPSAPSTPQASSSKSTPLSRPSTLTPLSKPTSISTPISQTLNASSSSREEDTQWHIPRTQPTPTEVDVGYRFESSYLPFLSGGGGRMAFGGFGVELDTRKDEEVVRETNGKKDSNEMRRNAIEVEGGNADTPGQKKGFADTSDSPDGSRARLNRGNGFDQRQGRGLSSHNTDVRVRMAADFYPGRASSSRNPSSPSPPASPRIFQRPAGFSSPPPSSKPLKPPAETPHQRNKGRSRLLDTEDGEKRVSLADELRKTISTQRTSASNTENTSLSIDAGDNVKVKGKKRKAAESEVPTPGKKPAPSPAGKGEKMKGIPLNLDAREEELRAQRKKEKKAKKKAERVKGE